LVINELTSKLERKQNEKNTNFGIGHIDMVMQQHKKRRIDEY